MAVTHRLGGGCAPGLKKTDDRTFVGAFQAIDRAMINPWFMTTFFGALILLGVAAAPHVRAERHALLRWIAAAFVLHLIAVIFSVAVNVPLNDALEAACDPATIDVAQARANFDEPRWTAFNHVMAVTSTCALVIRAGVLVSAERRRLGPPQRGWRP